MTAPEPNPADRIAAALLTARYWSSQWMPERDGAQGLAAVLMPVVEAIAAERAAEELRAAADEIEREDWRPEWAVKMLRRDADALAAAHEETL